MPVIGRWSPLEWTRGTGRSRGPITALARTPSVVLVGTSLGRLECLDLSERTCRPLATEPGVIEDVLPLWDGRILTVTRRRLKLHDPTHVALDVTLMDGQAGFRAVGVAGELVIAGGEDGVLRVFDPARPRPWRVPGHQAPITGVAAAHRCGLAASASADGTVRVVDLEDHQCRAIFSLEEPIWSLAWSPLGGSLLVGTSRGRLYRCWLGGSVTLLAEVSGIVQWVTQDCRRALSLEVNRRVLLWDLHDDVCQAEWRLPATAAGFHPDPFLALAGREDGVLCLLEPDCQVSRDLVELGCRAEADGAEPQGEVRSPAGGGTPGAGYRLGYQDLPSSAWRL